MDYTTWKLLHQGSVVLSVSGFAARGIGSLAGAAWMRRRIHRVWPHLVDTLLLVSALVMAWMLQLNPLTTPWLAAKIAGLLLYIALGMVALRAGRPLSLRVGAWLAALLVFGWIVSVALTKDPLGLLRLFVA